MTHHTNLNRIFGFGLILVLFSTLVFSEVQQRSATPLTLEEWQELRSSRAAEAISPAQRTAIQNAITSIGSACDSLTYTDSTGTSVTIPTSQIMSVLQSQLNNGRIRVDSSLSSNDYARCWPDGSTGTTGDQVDLHPEVASGEDSDFLEEVLVHEYLHKTQANSSRAADEIESYSLELCYKDSIGVAADNRHRGECVTNLAFYTNQLAQGSTDHNRRASAPIQLDDFVFQAVPGDTEQGEPAGWLQSRRTGGEDWGAPFILGEGLFSPRDMLVVESDPLLPEQTLLICGNDMSQGMILAVVVNTDIGMPVAQWPVYWSPDISDFHCMSPDPLYPEFTHVLDRVSNAVITLVDFDGDGMPDSFFDVFCVLPFEPGVTKRMDWEFHPIHGVGLLLDDCDKLYSTVSPLDNPMLFAQDLDGDLHVDSFFDVFMMDFTQLTPLIFNEPHPDDMMVEIYGSPHHPLEVWATTPEGDPIEPLGFGMLDWTTGPIELMRPLMPGEYIMPFDFASGLWQGQPTLVEEPCVPEPPVVTIDYTYDGLDRRIRLTWDAVECAEWYRVTLSRAYGPEETILVIEETEAEFNIDGPNFDSNDGMLKVTSGNGNR